MSSYLTKSKNKIVCEDCMDFTSKLPDACIDLAFTSPPYADVKKYEYTSGGGIHSFKFVDWFLPKVKEIDRILKPNGSFYLNIFPRILEGKRQLFVHQLILAIDQKTLLYLHDEVIWDKAYPKPYGGIKRLSEVHEYIFIFVKDPKDYTFNKDSVRTPYKESTLERLKYRTFKGWFKPDGSRTTEEYIMLSPNEKGASPKTIVKIPKVNRVFPHPAPFPLRLAEWVILLGSNPGDLVFDPMCGIGTVGKAALLHGRNFLCCDISSKYVKMANENISGTQKGLVC